MSPAGSGPYCWPAAGAAAYQVIAELRELNGEVLAVAAGLSRGTIETVLAKPDLQPGAEALLRGPAHRVDRRARASALASPPPGP